MAVSAKFQADYSTFLTATQAAESKLRSFEDGASKAGNAVNKMANSLQGTSLIQQATVMAEAVERVGGTSKLTERELARVSSTASEAAAKLRALGQDVPPGIQKIADAGKNVSSSLGNIRGTLSSLAGAFGVAFSLGAVVGFGKELLRMGDDIVRVADRTGLLTSEVQKLDYIAGQSGNTLDDLTSGIGQMQNRLASGDASAVAALDRLNVSFETLRNATPYQQLELIADAVGKIPNPATRAQLAMDLFGKSGISLLPTLTSKFKELGDAAPVMSDKTVQALDRAGDELARFQTTAKVWAAESYNYLSGFFDKSTARIYNYIAELEESIAGIYRALDKVPGANSAFPTLTEDIKGLTTQAQWFRDAARQMTTQLEQSGAVARSVVPAFEVVGKATKAAADQKRTYATVTQTVIEQTPEELRVLSLLAKAHEHQASALAMEASAFKASQKAAEDYIRNLPTAAIMGTRDLSGIVSQIGGAASTGGNLAGSGGSSSAGGFLAGLFGSSAQMGQQLATTILGAIQGGGSPVKAAAGLVGTHVGTSIAASLTKDGSKLFGTALGGVLNSALPIVGSLIAPLAGALWNKLFGTAGRDTVKDFVAQFGGFDAFHAMLGKELPQDAERLWIALTQGVGRNNPEQAKRIIAEIETALAAQKTKTEEAAAASADAARAQQDELDAISAKYSEVIGRLDSEYKSLSDSVAKEAEEEFKGLTQIAEEERMKQIEAEKKAQEAMRDAELEAKKSTFDEILQSGKTVDQKLRELFGKELVIPYRFEPVDGSVPGTSTYHPPVRPPSADTQPIQVTSVVNMDGRQVAIGVANTRVKLRMS